MNVRVTLARGVVIEAADDDVGRRLADISSVWVRPWRCSCHMRSSFKFSSLQSRTASSQFFVLSENFSSFRPMKPTRWVGMRLRNQYTSLRGFSQGSIIRNPICGHLCVPPGVAEGLVLSLQFEFAGVFGAGGGEGGIRTPDRLAPMPHFRVLCVGAVIIAIKKIRQGAVMSATLP
jgi:hypothetical protein